MKVFSPGEVAEQLNIKTATLRKYSILLEEAGYKIKRNSQNHRYYTDEDIITLRRIIANKNSDITLEEVINNVVSIHEHNTYINDTHNVVIAHNNEINELKEIIQKQTELIYELTKRLDQQEQRIKERDEKIVNMMNELLEEKKLLIEMQQKKSFFSRIFKREKT